MSSIHWHDFEPAHLRPSVVRWAVAGAAILVAHGLLAYGLFSRSPENPPASAAAALLIELDPMPVSTASTAQAPAGGQEASEDPDVTPAPQSASAAPSEAARPSTEESRAEAAEEPTPPAEVAAIKAEDVPQVPESSAPAEAVLPKLQPDKKPDRPRLQPTETKPRPARPRPAVRSEQSAVARRGQGVQENAQAGASQGAARAGTGLSQASRGGSAGANAAGASGAPSMSRAAWAAMVASHLARFKRPQGSNVGRPSVRFTVAASGAVASVSLARSSGSAALDGEVVAMVRRASPFPRPPAGVEGGTFTIPVNYTNR